MKDPNMDRILEDNRKLMEENRKLKEDLKELKNEFYQFKKNSRPRKPFNLENNDDHKPSGNYYFHNNFKEEFDDAKIKYNSKDNPEGSFHNDSANIVDMSLISFLARSNKRVEILKSLNQGDKIPSTISKEINDSSHHVSKYLSSLKEKELVVCMNEEDKRFRFYRITAKGKYYLEIIQSNQY